MGTTLAIDASGFPAFVVDAEAPLLTLELVNAHRD